MYLQFLEWLLHSSTEVCAPPELCVLLQGHGSVDRCSGRLVVAWHPSQAFGGTTEGTDSPPCGKRRKIDGSSFCVSFNLHALSAAWPSLCEALPFRARQVSRPQCLCLATYTAWPEAVFSWRLIWPPCLLSSPGSWCSCYLQTSWTAQGRKWELLPQMGGTATRRAEGGQK